MLLALAGCGLGDAGEATPDDTAQVDEPLYGFGTLSRRWPNGIVPVCWQEPDNFTELHGVVQQVLTDTWSAAANLTFKGWGPCTAPVRFINHVEVAFSTAPGYRANATGLGYGTQVITLSYDDWVRDRMRFRFVVIHEFGHILGFPHEMRRPDNWVGISPVWCGVTPSNSDYPQYSSLPGGIYLTEQYDVRSIMNYYYVGGNTGPGCNPVVHQQQLSDADIAGVQRPEAYGPPRPRVPRELLVAPRYLGQNGTGASGLRIESLLPSRAPSAWRFVAQDLDPTYAFDNTANWKVIGDLNSDGRSDLVAVIYLGQPTDPSDRAPSAAPTGLRIATALSTGPGTWTFTAQDVDRNYPHDDAANWKIAGDLNGDGRPELYTVNRNVPGGLRIQTALSTGPGTWTLVSQDVVSGSAAIDMAHWIASDINGDGRPDLFNTAYLAPGDNGSPTGVRVYSAFSTGPGTWNLTSQDVQMSLVPDDLGNWHPAVLNMNGRHDFINFVALEGDFPQVISIRLLSTARGTWNVQLGGVGLNARRENLASMRIADFNGDGFTDVASLAIFDTGLRVRTALFATAVFGTGFTSTFQDVDPTYATDDTTEWQTMDIDGDHVDDLVNVESLGPAGGLRIKALISHGDGTWTLTSQDVSPGGGMSNPAGWQVADARN